MTWSLSRLTWFATGLFLSACASQVPGPIRQRIPDSPTLEEVRRDPKSFLGERVRWGGTIAKVTNREEATWVQIVGRRLDSEGRPQTEDWSSGRFILVVEGFLDPMIYAEGRLITAAGSLEEPVTREIGEYAYAFPVVHAESYYLWPQQPRYLSEGYSGPYYPHPWYYGPWPRPFYSFHGAYWW